MQTSQRVRPPHSRSRVAGLSVVVGALAALVGLSSCSGPSLSTSVPVTRGRSAADSLLVDFSHRFQQSMVRHITGPRHGFGEWERPSDRLDGWSPVEPTADRSSWFAWATQTTASVRLSVVDREDDWLHFSAFSFSLGPGVAQTTRVVLNDVEVGAVTLAPGPFTAYSLPLPSGALEMGENTVSFHFAYVGSPSPPSARRAGRALAAAFDYVAISGDPNPPAGDDDIGPIGVDLGVSDDRVRLPSGTEVAFPVVVPPNGHVDFGVETSSTELDTRLRGEVAIRTVIGEAEGGSDDSTQPSEDIFFRHHAGDEPAHWQADLSEWAGERVALVFRASGGEPGETLEWIEPQLRSPTAPPTHASNVVLIVVDTLRADHLGSYGGEAHTPNLDALAASGVRFERTYSHVPITVPSHSSMFTSLLPTEHAALTNGSILSDAHLTLAEVLRDHYRGTAGFVSLGVLQDHAGVAQGFEVFRDDFGLDWWKSAEEMNAEILPWLNTARSPFFLWAHYSDPHEPYSAPSRDYASLQLAYRGVTLDVVAAGRTTAISAEFPPGISKVALTAKTPASSRPLRLNNLRTTHRDVTITCETGCRARRPGPDVHEFVTSLPATLSVNNSTSASVATRMLLQVSEDLSPEQARRRYREEVEYLDQHVGALLQRIAAVSPDTLIILTSDHGEDLGEHGSPGHVSRLYEQIVRVPLIFSWPGHLEAGLVVSDTVSHVDVLPTVLDLLEIGPSANARANERSGRSLVPTFSGASIPGTTDPVVVETFRPESPRSRKALITTTHKLIVTENPEDPDGPPEYVELYDLTADPNERDNRARQDESTRQTLSDALSERITLALQRAEAPQEQQLSDDQLERLRSLGYVR